MRLKLVVSENRKKLGFVICVLLLSACAAPKPKVEAPEDLLDPAPPAASSRAKKAVPPSSPMVKEAEALLAKGDADAARSKFEQAVQADAGDVRALLGLGLSLEALDKPAEAERAYRAALAAEPSFAEAHNNLGLLLRDRGDDAKAIEELELATAADPRLASAQINLALALEETGRANEAALAYDKAVQLAPKDAMLRANRGLFLLAQHQSEPALQQLRSGLAVAAGDRAALLALGNGFRRAGKPDEAVRALSQAVKAGDGKPTPALLSELALAQNAANDAAGAKASLGQALELEPRYATAHYLLGSIEAAAGDLRAARTHYERCIALEPKGPLAAKAKEKLAALKKQ
ncbi:MAG: domain protein putative component of TonB system [Myxococcaceae bacterium]|nr:domain protein putative component of TonB system [Myxococcaceae bacterium]